MSNLGCSRHKQSRDVLDRRGGCGTLRNRRYLDSGVMGGSYSRSSELDEASNTEGYYGAEHVRVTDVYLAPARASARTVTQNDYAKQIKNGYSTRLPFR